MAKRSVIRASDGEREAVTERLRHAAAEGRILASELEHRLTLALRARTVAELDALVADLPGTRRARQAPPAVRVVTYAAIAVAMVAVLALAALIIAGLFAAWAMWALIAWWFLGRGRHRGRGGHHRRYGRPPLRTVRRGLL